MDARLCAAIVHHFSHILYTDDPVDPAIVTHITACATCRGALLVLLADLIDVPPAPTTITCTQCAVDLAAYVDCELDLGLQTARETYPHVWWHLWLCLTCATTYQATRQLAQATRNGTLELPPLAGSRITPSTTVWYTTAVPPMVLAQVQQSVASVWGPLRSTTPLDPQVVVCDHCNDHTIELTLQSHGPTRWDAFIQIDPPLVGTVHVAKDTYQRQVPLNDHGQAQITDVPIGGTRLTDGSALTVTVMTPVPDT